MSTPPIRRPLAVRRAATPLVVAAVAAFGATGCSEIITMDFRGASVDLGEAIDFEALGRQIDIAANRIPAPLFDRMRSDVESFDDGLGLDRVQWLAESPSGAAAVDAMMAAFYLPLTDDPAIANPDLEAWFRGAVKNGQIEPATLAGFQESLAEAWRAVPAIAGLTPATIQFLKPTDAAASAKRGAAIAIALQVATGKDTFTGAMEAIEQKGPQAFVLPELGEDATKTLQGLTKDVNDAVAKRSSQVEVLGRLAERSGNTLPDPAPVPTDRPIAETAKTARLTLFFLAATKAPGPVPTAGR